MRRKAIHFIFRGITGLCAAVACSVLGIIVWAIVRRGWPAMSWHFLTEQIELVGAAGGIFYNLIGTIILISTAFMVSAPVASALALMHSVYLRHSKHRAKLAIILTALNGVPSILFGIFGMIVFVQALGWGKSWLTGGILLGFMILPTVSVALIERIDSLPVKYVEAAAGLGLNQSQIIWSVILPQSLGGLITGSLLGLARAAGETAPIMFTATIFAGATMPHGIKESPVLSLPYHIFILSQDSFDPSVGAKVWGSALTLLALVIAAAPLPEEPPVDIVRVPESGIPCAVDEVFARKCRRCHTIPTRHGAPFVFLTWQDTQQARADQPLTALIGRAVRSGFMPYRIEANPKVEPLTDDEKKIILDWIDAGAPRQDCEPTTNTAKSAAPQPSRSAPLKARADASARPR